MKKIVLILFLCARTVPLFCASEATKKEDAQKPKESPTFRELMEDPGHKIQAAFTYIKENPGNLRPENVNSKKDGNSMLHLLALYSWPVNPYTKNYIPPFSVKQLVDAKADINLHNDQKKTPLEVAVDKVTIGFDLVISLVDAKASITDATMNSLAEKAADSVQLKSEKTAVLTYLTAMKQLDNIGKDEGKESASKKADTNS